jgi:hypothetical protein
MRTSCAGAPRRAAWTSTPRTGRLELAEPGSSETDADSLPDRPSAPPAQGNEENVPAGPIAKAANRPAVRRRAETVFLRTIPTTSYRHGGAQPRSDKAKLDARAEHEGDRFAPCLRDRRAPTAHTDSTPSILRREPAQTARNDFVRDQVTRLLVGSSAGITARLASFEAEQDRLGHDRATGSQPE